MEHSEEIVKNWSDFARDRDYWNQFYKTEESVSQQSISQPSNFAMSVGHEMSEGYRILDLGCGNGRDSIYFLSKGMYVTGIDASNVAIEKLKRTTNGNPYASFICDDFVRCEIVYQSRYDYIYSRFTLHAIDDTQQDELLRNIKKALKLTGKIFIEARTVHDTLYGKGEQVGENAFIHDGHFRRFIVPEQLSEIMCNMGYNILSLQEGKGFSKYGDSDPVLMRLTASVTGKEKIQ